MFCPKCGEQQTSEAMRFCSGCGFKLNIQEEPLAKRLTKMALFLVLVACAIMGWGSVTSGPGYMQVRMLVTFIAVITFYLLFSHDLKYIFNKLFTQNIENLKQIMPAGEKPVLPPAQSIPVSAFGLNGVNTAEIVQPPSVTEQTTRLLDKREN
jgi:hypothetical protein